MPLWTVQHSVLLTSAQQDDLAEVITTVHCRRFGVPRVFVNLSFQDLTKSVEYVGGKRDHPNRIIAQIRPDAPGAGRSDEAIEAMLQEVHEGWDRIVGTKGEKSLGGIFALPTIKVKIEKGVVVPKPGFDFEWIQQNLESFKARAAAGEKEFASLVGELEARLK